MLFNHKFQAFIKAKNQLIILFFLLFTITIKAQLPPSNPDVFPYKVNYQGIIKDNDAVVAETNVTLYLSISRTSPLNSNIFQEEHSLTTDSNGVFSLLIGEGVNQSVSLSTIDWSDGPYFLKTSFKYTGEAGAPVDLGSIQLVTVPYALHAKTAESIIGDNINETDPIYTGAPASGITAQNISDWNNLEESGWTVVADTTYTMKNVSIGTESAENRLFVNDTLSDSHSTAVRVEGINLLGGTDFNTGVFSRVNTTTDASGYGFYGTALGASTTGYRNGVRGVASGSDAVNRGVIGTSHGTGSNNFGVIGFTTGVSAGTNFGTSGVARNGTTYNVGTSGLTEGHGSIYNRGIQGFALGNSGGITTGDNVGVFGFAEQSTARNTGVHGVASGDSFNNYGLRGETTATGQANYGLNSTATGNHDKWNYGASCYATGATDSNFGVLANTNGVGLTNYGVYGLSNGNTTNATSINYGVYGAASGAPTNYAGFFEGDVTITGNLNVTGTVAKAGGTFKIDHPQDPENKYLVHSFVESPEMMNVYNGNTVTDANGYSTVKLPDYFEAANKDFRYQLTVIGTFAQAIIKEKISGNKFIIQTDKPNVEVSWQVTGIRADQWANANRVMPEEEKNKKGTYLHPELFGTPKEKGVNYVKHNKAVDTSIENNKKKLTPSELRKRSGGEYDME